MAHVQIYLKIERPDGLIERSKT